ncbi:hypothetical protein DQ04_04041000 [Trypanosoma grayi]|uniref:hypothetical protein n=1 Tax=Trypanosoma grayi TaxID=71804 RepID=UPI0004F4632A|nr:hypothetical protein DQ04_04041000 [Trypanosoma grayi]KEG10208.1 hypothetical protein DQ04_04041000 [Trypanosoma grayi]
MMPRTWCPTLSANSPLQFDKVHLLKKADEYESTFPTLSKRHGTAKQSGAVAAQCGVAVNDMGTELTRRVGSSIPQFSAYLVASRVAMSEWPRLESASVLAIHQAKIPLISSSEDENSECIMRDKIPIVVHHISHIWKARPELGALPIVQMPSDQLVDFITYIMRLEAERKNYGISESARHLALMPALSSNISLNDVLGALSANHRMVEQLRSLVVAGEFAEETDATELQDFLQAAQGLTTLGVPRTMFARVAETFVPLLKASTIRVVDMECNDLGLAANDSDAITLLAEYLKENKFLLELNLSYNNIDGSNAKILLGALSVSDTRLTPRDLSDGEDDTNGEEEAEGGDLLNLSFFLPHVDDEEEEEEEEEEVQEERPEEETEENGIPAAAAATEMKAAGEGTDDDEEEEEGEEEEEEEEDENGNESGDNDENEEEGEEDEEAQYHMSSLLAQKFRRFFRRLQREEKKARVECVNAYVEEADALVLVLRTIRAELAEEKRIAIEKYCQRRSGWSHLQVLRLRGNPIGNEGAAGVAAVLRYEVLLTEEEMERIRAELSEKAGVLLTSLLSDRRNTALAEVAQRRQLLYAHRTAWTALTSALAMEGPGMREASGDNKWQPPPPPSAATEEGEEDDWKGDDDDDEIDHPAVAMTDVPPDVDFADDATGLTEEEAQLEESRDNFEMPFPPSKLGLQSLRLLDLCSCNIGSQGAKRIGDSLTGNKSLEVLLLRHNAFARKRVALRAVDEEADEELGEGVGAVQQVDVPHYVSPGCVVLFDALSSNTTLKVLDLAYNNMYPESIRCLSKALSTNSTLTSLSLESNCMGFNESPYEMDPAVVKATGYPVDVTMLSRPSCFLELLRAVATSSITTLLLGHNDLSHCWGEMEAEMLAKICCRLHVLHLNGNGLGPDQITQWAASAGADSDFTLKELQLSRNNLRGEEGGAALARLFARCKTHLETLFIDETQLGSSGAFAALSSFEPSALRSLSIRNAGLSLVPALPRFVLAPLRHLLISDNPFNASEMLHLLEELSVTATDLTCLSLWSREVDMEAHLPALLEVLCQMPHLLFADFGMLPRFDDAVDAEDPLGRIEAILVERRLAWMLDGAGSCEV